MVFHFICFLPAEHGCVYGMCVYVIFNCVCARYLSLSIITININASIIYLISTVVALTLQRFFFSFPPRWLLLISCLFFHWFDICFTTQTFMFALNQTAVSFFDIFSSSYSSRSFDCMEKWAKRFLLFVFVLYLSQMTIHCLTKINPRKSM